MRIHKHTVVRTPDMQPKVSGYDEVDVITGDYHSTTIVDNPRGHPATSTGFIVRASDWNEMILDGFDISGFRHPIGGTLEVTCIWCGQEYREVKYRWRDEYMVGCSKCGAPKGDL